jgi:xylulokinase
MKCVVAFDIGTTAVKGVLVSEQGEVLYAQSETVTTIYDGDHKEQDPKEWYELFCRISRTITSLHCEPENIVGIIMSGQMQDVILVDRRGESVGNAILYSDGRAVQEAGEILALLGAEVVQAGTGNNFDATIPLAKLRWLQRHEHQRLRQAYKVLISSKDYCVLRLTGEFYTDYTSAATSGIMDIATKQFKSEWLSALGLDESILPELASPGTVVGEVVPQAAHETGYHVGTRVFNGIGDAGATTLASGIKARGEVNINLGTSGWVATISDSVIHQPGVFNLVSADKDLYINVVPFLNAGNAHKWAVTTLADAQYADYADLLTERRTGSGGVLFLPYLVGERFPVMDGSIKGCYYGITPETTKTDLASAVLEGVAFSIRQGLERVAPRSKKITLIGGGAKEEHWCQILADVLGKEVHVFTNTEFLSSVAIAGLALARDLAGDDNVETYAPAPENVEMYNRCYERFAKLYPRLKGLE